jgi:hypothetical protein
MDFPFYQISVPSLLPSTGTNGGLAGRRTGASFFARNLDYFIVTRNFTAIYLDLVPFRNFTVTRSLLPSTETGKKRGTATQTAPNQTAGPLGVMPGQSESLKRGNFSGLSLKIKVGIVATTPEKKKKKVD